MNDRQRSVFDEMNDVKRLIEDNRAVAYRLQDDLRDIPEDRVGEIRRLEELIRDKEIVVNALEIRLAVLEQTLQARLRTASRKNSAL